MEQEHGMVWFSSFTIIIVQKMRSLDADGDAPGSLLEQIQRRLSGHQLQSLPAVVSYGTADADSCVASPPTSEESEQGQA